MIHVQQSDLTVKKKEKNIKQPYLYIYIQSSKILYNVDRLSCSLYPHSRCSVYGIALFSNYRIQRFRRIEGAGLQHDRDTGMQHGQQSFIQAVHMEERDVQAHPLLHPHPRP